MAEHVNKDSFNTKVLESSLPVLVDFYSDYCMPCKMMAPIFEMTEKQYEGKLEFVKVNTDVDVELAINYGISSIPAFVLFKGGKPVASRVGSCGPDELSEWIDSSL